MLPRRALLLIGLVSVLAGMLAGLVFLGPAPGHAVSGPGTALATPSVHPSAEARSPLSSAFFAPSLPAAEPTTTASPSPSPTATPTPSPSPSPTPTPTPTPRATPAPTPAPTAKPTVTPTGAPTPAPPVAACSVFPSTNVWNRDISSLPVRSDSATLVASIGLDDHLHPDFSATGYGIPINVVGPDTPRSAVSFQYADESDPGPYPIPANPLIEGGSDRHLIMWDKAGCRLFELFAAVRTASGWTAGSGAIWDLRSNALRPDGWTSADAAGLPILPGLVRYDEVAAGAIHHAIRFTAPVTRSAHIYPARHHAGAGNDPALPPMGLRVRLKADVDISGFGPQSRVILTALKRYGMILADNGSPWYITGAPDARWDDDELHDLHGLTGADFEVVDTSGLVNP